MLLCLIEDRLQKGVTSIASRKIWMSRAHSIRSPASTAHGNQTSTFLRRESAFRYMRDPAGQIGFA